MATYITIETDKKIAYQIDGGDKQTMFANIEDDGYPEPTGTITITQNGTGIDVKDYAEADVNVSGSGGVTWTEYTATTTATTTESARNLLFPDYVTKSSVVLAAILKNKSVESFHTDQFIALICFKHPTFGMLGTASRYRNGKYSTAIIGDNYDAFIEIGDTFDLFEIDYPVV